MDFPIYHLDFMGNRMLIAIIAIVHVLINHALAVGLIPYVTYMEFRGYQLGKLKPGIGRGWDETARKLMFTAFIITTSVGALTGVGIWFAASLANPASIGSLVRVFFFAWFVEWVIFLLEVVFIMVYFLTWKRSNESARNKKRHILFGVWLSVFSWLTMAVIVGILGFMMDPGSWHENRSLITGFANPMYLPQLIFRTPVAMLMAGCFALMFIYYFIPKALPARSGIVKYTSLWILQWTPVAVLGGFLYYWHIPRFMIGNLPVALGTQAFQSWYSGLLWAIGIALVVGLTIGVSGLLIPKKLPKHLLIIPVLVSFFFLGTFERLREFIRKPYVIGEYMYSNGLLKEEYPLYEQTGLLTHSAYSPVKEITSANRIVAGEAVFNLACTRCHTTHGINGIVRNFEKMYGSGTEFEAEPMMNYVRNMHRVRVYMPPFPGNEQELEALVAYIMMQKQTPSPLEGVQVNGIRRN